MGEFPRAPRLDRLRSALAKLDPAAAALRRPLTAKKPQNAALESPEAVHAALTALARL